ncbi:SIR2 family protein [Chitinophaga oryzae]|uniref:SIR2 family protein n=1 Tax=Chitinophaga oryzae TaxID=2725414 RepID=A0ABX6LFT9_9BACT|nr:SIR2 family protein [Chitinophaga oryzae]QJB38785.1 SIR2 family protein [Chitinophaga oryzae]
MEHILDIANQQDQLFALFKKLQESNTILLLGAGASVTEKKYLSNEVIQYYQAEIGKDLNEPDVTKFVDLLSADDTFSRKHFDSFVSGLLKKLKVTEAHKILASIPWREIITTNYDLLVEQAYDEISGSSQKIYDLLTIRNAKQYNRRISNTEVKYIKLNGCMADMGLYPFAFSTEDFNKLKPFYKLVLNDLKNLSADIAFLSMGYSYKDKFGTDLLAKFDSYNYREKKWMYNVDPYPNEAALSYFTQNKVCIIKCTFQEFFLKYREWESHHQETLVKKRGLSITNSQDHYITLPAKLLLNIDGIVRQLNTHTKDMFVKDAEFYKGEEPTYNLITRDVDVIKRKQIDDCLEQIKSTINKNHATFLPLFFITGEFGIGKSTFALRLIYEFQKQESFDTIAFEILDFNKVKKDHLKELIELCKAKTYILYCDEVEIESHYKSLLELQRELSIEQFQDCSIFFVVPIRENILEKYKLSRTVPRAYQLKINGQLVTSEIDDLVTKLNNANLITFRDALEKRQLITKIENEYDSDSFIMLMELITSGRHEADLIQSYNELTKDTQKAFLYTALLHRHKLLMPANWLKQNISMSWDDFTEKVIKAEGKGLLIQVENKNSYGVNPSLFFRTKHPLIAEKLVERFLPNKDKQYEFYDRMLKTIEPGQTNSYLANDLLKSFVRNESYNDYQIDKLYDAAYTRLSDDPYFLLNFATNLQRRKNEADLKRALELLVYAESKLEWRNHRFIHRRGVISFELAKMCFEDGDMSYATFYINEAKELFEAKQLLDPFSSYSYVDYIKMLIWKLQVLDFDESDKMLILIQIEELLEIAYKTVTYGLDRIDKIKSIYSAHLEEVLSNSDYKEYLDSLYSDFHLKPYACILLYNYHLKKNQQEECERYLNELEYYQENFEVVKFLFKYYGNMLHIPNIRIKFLRLSSTNPGLEKENPLRFNYFNFIAETYNHHFHEGKGYLNNIQSKFFNLNPEFRLTWNDPDGAPLLFEAKIVRNHGEKYKAIKISSIQQTIKLVKGDYKNYNPGDFVRVKINFFLYGLMAEILD